jgi:hypothetical protein
VTRLTTKAAEVGWTRRDASGATMTKPLPDSESAKIIGALVRRADEDFAEDMVVALEVRTREAHSDEIELSEFLKLVDRNSDGSPRE